MDYRRSQYQSNQRQGKREKREEEPDSFIRLSDHEIAGCITDMGIPFTPGDIQRPQPQMIQRVFEYLAEMLMNTSRETVEPAMREAARDVCGDELMDVVPAETRNLMGFYASLRRLLAECGIRDFAFSDLTRPTHARLAKHLSYVINFVRFREQQSAVIEEHFNRLAATKQRIESLHTSNANLESRRDDLKDQRARLAAAAERNDKSIGEIRAHLLSLKQETEGLTSTLDSSKAQKNALTKQLQDLTARNLALRQECDKLRPYAVASGAALQAQLGELAGALGRDKATLAGSEKRLRALHVSADTFALAGGDVQPVVGLLGSLQRDMHDEDAEAADAARRRDALAERSLNVRAIEREEDMLKTQLRRWYERTDTLRKNADDRSDVARGRMLELSDEHQKLMSQRGEKGREVERRKARVEQTEKKMADLKENIESEVNAARDEYMKMDAHIKLYITEMEQFL